ncbi:MAG TPA: nuclear transport factor 2 family protein [Gaiellaceae bacterium]|jgi:hypothetical protein|nr:nuclear transport factor 2 family protein [Gaiellaceae bacterium]
MTDVVDRVLVALNARDLEAFVVCYAADATIENGHDDVFVRGQDELRSRYGPLFEQLPDLRIEAVGRTVVGEFVVQEEVVTGRGEPERHVAVYLVRDGLIARERLIR